MENRTSPLPGILRNGVRREAAIADSTRQEFVNLYRDLTVRVSLIGKGVEDLEFEAPFTPTFAREPNARILEIRNKIDRQLGLLYDKAVEAANQHLILDEILRLQAELPAQPRQTKRAEPCYLIVQNSGKLALHPENGVFFMERGLEEIQLAGILEETNLYLDALIWTPDPQSVAADLFDRFVDIGNLVGRLPYTSGIIKGAKFDLTDAGDIRIVPRFVIPRALAVDIAKLNILRHRLSAPTEKVKSPKTVSNIPPGLPRSLENQDNSKPKREGKKGALRIALEEKLAEDKEWRPTKKRIWNFKNTHPALKKFPDKTVVRTTRRILKAKSSPKNKSPQISGTPSSIK